MFRIKKIIYPAIFLLACFVNAPVAFADDCFCGTNTTRLGDYGLENQCRIDCRDRNYTTYRYGTGSSRSVNSTVPYSDPSNLGGGCVCDGAYIGNIGTEAICRNECYSRRRQNYNYENTGNRATGYNPSNPSSSSPPPAAAGASGSFDYKTMESIPGVIQYGQTYTFNQYISAVYNFAIWAVGIAALLMLSIGGYMYLTSAGNNAAMSSAKGVITDALIGLVLALFSWLLLYIINPDLVNPVGIIGGAGGGAPAPAPGPGPGPAPTPTPPAPTPTPGGRLSDASARSTIQSAGMNIQSSGNCSDPNNSRCTSLEGIPSATVPKITNLRTTCGITDITGGTETGHQTHGQGRGIIDVRASTPQQKACLANNASSLGIRSMCTSLADRRYQTVGNCGYNEPTNIFHLDFGDRA